ncbi:MAG: cation-translocating P-type ATPase [Clostridia bacterium]|nr:cation-translocating P-type ATPase [Clostridia bacterium]
MYNLSVEESLKKLKTQEGGLSDEEAKKRLEENGYNKLVEGKKKTFFSRIIEQLKNVMIIILIIAATISLVTAIMEDESITESLVIYVVVLLNTFLGALQESKAEKAIDALKKMSLPYINVRRNGKIIKVKTEELVVGDIVLIEAGDYVPADMRIIKNNSLRVEEAALTGESLPINKHVNPIDGSVALGDRRNMLYSGSSVAYGRGEGVVCETGMKTEMGKIAAILSRTKEELTPLQKKMNEISKILTVVVVIIGLAMVVLGIAKNNPPLEIFMLAVSLAVAAIPEGLPASITIILSIGVQKMAKQNSIIRKMSSVETLGATQIICSDKTGTLTQNKMTVKAFAINNEISNDCNVKDELKSNDEFLKLIHCMSLCNDIKESKTEEETIWLGDPTEIALGEFAQLNGFSKLDLEDNYERVAEIPFDSVRKMMTTVNKVEEQYINYTKGAVESIIERCEYILLNGKRVKLTEKIKEDVIKNNNEMSSKALRVLAYAYKEQKEIPKELESDKVEKGLTFIGLTGMIDPPRPEVKDSVKECFKAGMIPVMITGDNKETAVAIAEEIGIIEKGNEAITGAELDELTDEEFLKRIRNIRVYARVSPENKVRIVETWKKLGKIVAMTGDGVNDAPALKTADIGVGMGITGTEVSKSVASMILTDDNFASIVVAVKEGRRIYNNIQNVIVYLLATNIAEVIIVFLANLFNSVIFTPIQLLWINLVTDTIPAMTLGFEPADKKIMSEKPRDAKEKFFTPFLVTRILVLAILKSIMVLTTYFILENNYTHEVASTVAFILLSVTELLFAFSVRSNTKSVFTIGLCSNKQMLYGVVGVLIVQIVAVFLPIFIDLLGLIGLTTNLYILAFVLPVILFFIAEITKLIIAKIFKLEEK